LNRELETGALLVAATSAPGSIRASQLGGMALYSFKVIPSRLTGLITLGEQHFFETADRGPRLFSSRHPAAMRMGELCTKRGRGGLLFRLQLLEVFAELFGDEAEQDPPVEQSTDARKRLQDFLEQTPSSELLEMSFSELARKTRCTSRHLSRIFHELTGISFRDKRAELRLARARELLATTDCKVVDVAMESGYKSLSLFNLMFARHFGMSPGRWRKQQIRQVAEKRLLNKKLKPLASTALMPVTFA
jgi:AraC-like DNA-binding protein